METDKRGIATLSLVLIVIAGLVLVGILGVISYTFDIADDSLSQLEGQLGNISFSETYQDTLQKGILAGKTTMPQMISMGALLGMILAMMIVAYNITRVGQLWFLLDIGILILVEIIAVVVRDSFTAFMNSSPEFLAIFSTTLSPASKFVLNGPIIFPIVWALIVIATYFITRKKEGPSGFE